MKPETAESRLRRAAGLLGGEQVINGMVTNQMDAHELLIGGLPAGALLHLVGTVTFMKQRDALQKTVGLRARTLQRL